MQVFSFFILIFFINNSFACELNKKFDFYSLSGPISMLLEDLDLLEDAAIKGISTFHPVLNFKGQRLGGGIFLSPKIFRDPAKAVVFYDESRELSRNLSKVDGLTLIEVITREQDVFESTMASISKMKPFLVNCETKLAELTNEIHAIKKRLIETDFSHKELIFFIDRIKENEKRPNLIMVKDGFVLTFLKYKKIATFDSPLAYVPWSQKKLKKDYVNYFNIGLENSGKDELSIEKINEKTFNLSFRGVLTPGISQMRFVNAFLDFKYKG